MNDSSPETLIAAIRALNAGRKYLDSNLSNSLYHFLVDAAETSSPVDAPYGRLTSREQEIFRLLAIGKTTGEISTILHIIRKTVDNHRLNIMRKLELNGITELIHLADNLGVV